MNEQELKFQDDKLYVYTPLPQYGEGICKVEVVMTKEIFQECYKKWIEPQKSNIPIPNNTTNKDTIKAMFPDIEIGDSKGLSTVCTSIDNISPVKTIPIDVLQKIKDKLLDYCDPRARTETEIPIKTVLKIIDEYRRMYTK